jgi:hypothetical protein
LKPAEQELPLMPSPPSMNAAACGASSVYSIETRSPYFAAASRAAPACSFVARMLTVLLRGSIDRPANADSDLTISRFSTEVSGPPSAWKASPSCLRLFWE